MSPPESRSVGGLVLNPEGSVLFVQEFGEYWGLPRGHVEAGEDDIETIVREIHEEAGIQDLTYICDLGGYTRSTFDQKGEPNYKEIKHLTYYCFKTSDVELRPQDQDITDVAWLKHPEARSRLVNRDDIDFFDKSISKIVQMGLLTLDNKGHETER